MLYRACDPCVSRKRPRATLAQWIGDCVHAPPNREQRRHGQDSACWAVRHRNYIWLWSSVQGYHSDITKKISKVPPSQAVVYREPFDLPPNQADMYTTVIKGQLLACIHSLECASTQDYTGFGYYKTWGRDSLASSLQARSYFHHPPASIMQPGQNQATVDGYMETCVNMGNIHILICSDIN